MKIKILIISVILICFSSHSHAQRMGIAAIVNNDIITHSDVEGRVQLGLRASNIKDSEESRKKIEAQALNSLIEEQLRLQEAKRLNIEIPQEDIQKAIDNIANQNKVDPQKFKEILGQSFGALPSLERQIRSQLSWTQVIRQRLRPQVNVTEADIDNFIADLNKHEGKSEYNLAEIFLKVNDDGENAKQKALAQDLVKQIRAGASFPGIARQFSQGSEARNGGAIGWVLEGILDPALDQAIKTMTPQSVSEPIRSDFGYHILLLRDQRTVNTSGAAITEVQIKQTIIPLLPEANDTDIAEAEATAKSLQQKTKGCDAMDNLITAQNSPMTKDLGFINEQQLPAFVKNAIQNLANGQLSEPVRVSEGYLLVMVCDRRQKNTDNELRDQIANKIGMDRLERLQQRYVRDLKATAYIDIKN